MGEKREEIKNAKRRGGRRIKSNSYSWMREQTAYISRKQSGFIDI